MHLFLLTNTDHGAYLYFKCKEPLFNKCYFPLHKGFGQGIYTEFQNWMKYE